MDLDTAPARPIVRGPELRYLLTIQLFETHEQTVTELIAGVRACGFELDERASKAVSDALRWEIGRGRVRRVRRGIYRRGSAPRSTYYWIRKRVMALREPGAVPRGW
ncbi:hypothetical protein B7486_70485 [cyanobacterium TDX16]|nr:hypothetical protein B7486_70485 [cyanobacterium TDX16]